MIRCLTVPSALGFYKQPQLRHNATCEVVGGLLLGDPRTYPRPMSLSISSFASAGFEVKEL